MREVLGRAIWGRGFAAARQGAAATEFAIIAPMLIVLVGGIISYGGYFWTAHTVQQVANDAARAAIAGLDDGERRTLASAAMDSDFAELRLPKMRTQLQGARQGQTFVVEVTYDASASPFWAFSRLENKVTRRAAIQLGGF